MCVNLFIEIGPFVPCCGTKALNIFFLMAQMQTAARNEPFACLADGRGEKGLHINGKLAGSVVKSN